MSMRNAVLTDRTQEKSDQLAVSSLSDHEESSTMRSRFQDIRRIALHNSTVNREIWVFGTLSLNEMVEHLLGTHIRIKIGREWRRPGQDCRPLPCGDHINLRMRCSCVVQCPLECFEGHRRTIDTDDDAGWSVGGWRF
jgi:hypothetical protein